MRINLFNEGILCAWKANLDIQIVLEPYGCASYKVGYLSKSQRGMSAQLDAAAKEARKGNLDLKKQVRHIGNVFSNCVEVSAQEAVYLDLQILLTKCTRDIVFVNTSVPEERIFLLKPKAALDELPAESTIVESDNVIQRFSKRPKQLINFCLADYVSKVDIIYHKGNKVPEKVNDKNEDDRCDSSSSNESEDSLDDDNSLGSDLLYKTKMEQNIKKEKCRECQDEPVYAFLTGGAGVGKSVVIRALYQTLYRISNLKDGENPDDKRILLCAYMGFAAFNISGQTICSAFHKKMYKGTNHLSADELNTFRIKYRHLKVVIVDEISMVCNKMLSFIDIRLQQLTGSKAAFGGLSVIAVGDLYQLKPVNEFLICLDLKEGASSLARNLWKELFTMYELVDIMRQKDGLAFAQLLNRLRLNGMTEEDKQKLQIRVFDRDTGDYPKDAVHLFARNVYVKKHNDNILVSCQEKNLLYPVMTMLFLLTFLPKNARG